jgi:membrane protein DedA with SNARE-associated domain
MPVEVPVTEILIQYIEAVAAYAPVWGLLIVFCLMTIESSFIPFPSEVVMIPAGFLAARGELLLGDPVPDAVLVLAAGVVGSLSGAYINYFLARWLGIPMLERYGKYLFLPPEKLHRAEAIFREYGAGATLVCRLLPVIRQLISIPAGLSGMPLASFTLWTGLGAAAWVTILTAIGYGLGVQSADMSYADLVHAGKSVLGRDLVYIVPVLLASFAIYVWLRRRIMAQARPA